MTIAELQSLRGKLPYGWSAKASKELGRSKAAITKMMNGTGPIHLPTVSYLIKLAEDYSKEKKALAGRINKLTTN